jgi:hypothetical protein
MSLRCWRVEAFHERRGARKPIISERGIPAKALRARRLPEISEAFGVPAWVMVCYGGRSISRKIRESLRTSAISFPATNQSVTIE